MDWLSSLNDAMAYIEENLAGEIDLAHAARLACCSPYHLQRMFSYMAGVPLSEYIRRRRMTRAVFDLRSGEKVLDVALKYGYDSPTAFNRAFQGVHGAAPSAAKTEGVALKAYPPISFKITIKGEAEMNYRIEKMDAFRIVGVKMTGDSDEGFSQVPKFWAKTAQAGKIPQICSLMNAQPMGLLGVSTGDWPNAKDFDYYIAAASTSPTPEGMEEYTVPAATWAVFECVGPMPGSIQELQKRIVTEWLPNSGYQYADAPDIEVYSEGDQSAADYVCWVWLPIEKKED